MSENKLPALLPLAEVQSMAKAAAASKLFGASTPEQMLTLMLVAQAEGLHPMTACQTYDVIQGRPAMKAQAMLARFQQAGGKVEYTERSDKRVCATFTHPQSGSVEVDWDIDRAQRAGLAGKDNWKKFARSMLTARVISEGVRACYPAALGGFYTPEEAADFSPRDVNPRPVRRDLRPEPKVTEVIDPETGEVLPAADPDAGLPTAADVRGILKPQENLATGDSQDPFPPSDDVGVSKQPELAPQSWDHWAREAHRAILTAANVDALDLWADANADTIAAFTNAHRDRGEKLQKFYVKRRGELEG